MNRVIFLGTGSASNRERRKTGLLFEVGSEAFLIDAGDGHQTVRDIITSGVAINKVKSACITHRHMDHILGIPAVLFHSVLLGDSSLFTLYGPQQTLEILEPFIFSTHDYPPTKKDAVVFHPIASGERINPILDFSCYIDTVQLAYQYQAEKLTCMAYRVQIGNISIVYSGDMQPDASFDALASGASIMIHECFGLSGQKEKIHAGGHSTAEDAGVAAAKAGVKRLVLTHITPTTYLPDPAVLVAEAKKHFTGEVFLATDLMVMQLE